MSDREKQYKIDEAKRNEKFLQHDFTLQLERERQKQESDRSGEAVLGILQLVGGLFILCTASVSFFIKSFTNPQEAQEIVDNASDNIPVIGWLNDWGEQFQKDRAKSEEEFKKKGDSYWVYWSLIWSVKAVMMSLHRCGMIWLFFAFWYWLVAIVMPGTGVVTVSGPAADFFFVLEEKFNFIAICKSVIAPIALIWWLAMGPLNVRQNQAVTLVVNAYSFLLKKLVDLTYWIVWLCLYPAMILALFLLLATIVLVGIALIAQILPVKEPFVFALEILLANGIFLIAFMGETISVRFPPSRIRRGVTWLTIVKVVAGLLFLLKQQSNGYIDPVEAEVWMGWIHGWLTAQVLCLGILGWHRLSDRS